MECNLLHLSLKKQNFIEIAKECAIKSDMVHKHGCVIVYKNEVISCGYNYRIDMNHYSIHAELDAIHKVKNKNKILPKCVLYVVRIDNNHCNKIDCSNNIQSTLKSSKPCKNCEDEIKKYNIKMVYYS